MTQKNQINRLNEILFYNYFKLKKEFYKEIDYLRKILTILIKELMHFFFKLHFKKNELPSMVENYLKFKYYIKITQ